MALPSVATLNRLARRLLSWPGQPRVWLLRGPLGAGKTTLARATLRALGVRRRVNSPTFSLVQRYRLPGGRWGWVVHVDGYRLRRTSERAALEINEHIANPAALVLVEWPERLGKVRWGKRLDIRLSHRPLGRRARVVLRRW